jgi:hypothetical protein
MVHQHVVSMRSIDQGRTWEKPVDIWGLVNPHKRIFD